MSATFISYRRNDSAGHTGRLYDHLCKALGEDSVFRDIDTIKPGTDFVEAVREGIQRCSTLLVVIGNQWLTAEDDSGRRLDHPLDYVRLEICSALKQGIQVIPVLVEGAKMPDQTDLPEEISSLARLQALQLSDDRWDYDIGRLISALDKPAKEKQQTTSHNLSHSEKQQLVQDDTHTPASDDTEVRNRHWFTGAIAILFVLIGGMTVWAWYEKPKDKSVAKVTEKISPEKERKALSSNKDIKIDKIEKREEFKSIIPETGSSNLQQEQKIDQLLAKAEKNILNMQLTAPIGNNAVEKYHEILNLQPGHSKALLGLDNVSRKYTDLATQALKTNKIKKADSYLRLAKSISPDNPEISRVERLLKLKQGQQQISKNSSTTINNTQKKNQLTQDALLQTQLACKNSCNNRSSDCKKSVLPNSCTSNLIQAECERLQNECLHDPQTILTWGEFAANAECRGRYAQCKEDRTEKCETIQNDRFKKCDSLEDRCLKSC
jgi:hypothetical protein